MRAAQLNQTNVVINYAEVSSYTDQFINPMNSVIGSIWNGSSFMNPPPLPPVAPDASTIIQESYNASLQRKAVKLQQEGQIFQAVQLLLKAQGIQS